MKSIRYAPYTLLLIGLIVCIPSVFFGFRTYTFVSESQTAQGEVTELIRRESGTRKSRSIQYAPAVSFQTQGGEMIEFQSRMSSNPPRFYRGERVTVLYDPQRPHNARIDSFSTLWFFPLMFGGFGLLFGGAGAGILIYRNRKKKRAAHLKRNGTTIQAEVTDVTQNRSYKNNGRSPYNIYAQFNETGNVYSFKSDNIWFDPAEFVKKGSHVTVYTDPYDKTTYHMDLSFLPNHKY